MTSESTGETPVDGTPSDGTTAVRDVNAIDASPTKDFFIFMLTKDVSLKRAILDLVDNSVDAAVRTAKRAGQSDYSGFTVKVNATPEQFSIHDNCGGMSIAVARHVAFRFGRPAEVPDELKDTSGQIGQFGVGMKRTMFKLGMEFEVTSTTPDSHFVVKQNVEKWKTDQDKDGWSFSFNTIDETPQDPKNVGTTVEVRQLHESVARDFALDSFIGELREEIVAAHSFVLRSGLSVALNNVPVTSHPLELLQSDHLRPAHVILNLDDGIQVKIFAGVHRDRDFHKGGWYVFCHKRMVLGPERTLATGWGTDGTHQYHADFAYFRGYVFFDAEDTSLLPWTTTKTGIDQDSPVYRRARLDMMVCTRQVQDYLRQLASEVAAVKHEGEPNQPLADAMKSASLVPVEAIDSGPFTAPKRVSAPKPKSNLQRIQYDRPKERVKRVMEQLGVDSFKKVGESTFDYYYSSECE